MLEHKKEISGFYHHKNGHVLKIFTVPVVTVVGLLTSMLPSQAVIDTYGNDYRSCAGRLVSVGVTAEAAAEGCATALRPRDLSSCVATIKKQTTIDPAVALKSCRQARNPNDIATCVVGISKNTNNAINPDVLSYCGRSLLPVTFANCVVGLRKELDLAPTQALDTCIDSSNRSVGIGAGSTPMEFAPRVETAPMPSTPSNGVR
ncbi:MAG: hypothetical protein EAZ77_10750 [Nostocales cyanobacterium]|nr:MAG: hypothetical protein EAZ77_10750 [Nostocales cyanobacterium]